MPQYLVTMEIADAGGAAVLPIDELTGLLREAILPSLDALADLRSRGKLVAGGYPVGRQSLVLVVEADSEEQLYETLEGLPFFGLARTNATELRSFEDLRRFSEPAQR